MDLITRVMCKEVEIHSEVDHALAFSESSVVKLHSSFIWNKRLEHNLKLHSETPPLFKEGVTDECKVLKCGKLQHFNTTFFKFCGAF